MTLTAGDLTSRSELEQLVRDHSVRWKVYPEWGTDASWQQQKVGFDLELTGTHFEPKHEPFAGCDECAKVYAALRRIAESILPSDPRPTKYEIEVFTGRLAFMLRGAPSRVTVTIRLVHREGAHDPVDDCEVTCLAEMEHALAALGARRE